MLKSISIPIPVGLMSDVHDLATVRGEEPIAMMARCIRLGLIALGRQELSATEMASEVAALGDSLEGRP